MSAHRHGHLHLVDPEAEDDLVSCDHNHNPTEGRGLVTDVYVREGLAPEVLCLQHFRERYPPPPWYVRALRWVWWVLTYPTWWLRERFGGDRGSP